MSESLRCEWCDRPAAATVTDQWRTVMPSGSVFTGGPGRLYRVCEPCRDRLSERYLKTRAK